MAERKLTKPEIASQKRTVKLAPAIGDWTTYKPPKVLGKKVKSGLYGFDRLSKEDLNQALLIHYRFIQELLKHFKIDLSMAVELFSVQVEQTTYLNFLQTLAGPVVQCKISIPGAHDSIFLFFELPLANSIINHALGSSDLEPVDRALTESEKNVFSTTLAEYLPGFSAAFENVIENLSLTFVSSPDVVTDPTISSSSTLASFIAETSLADNPPGKIIIAYPGRTLKNLLGNYSQKDQAKPLDFSRLPNSLVSKIFTPVSATLGEAVLTTNEIKQLEVGDVVSLETLIASPIPATIGEILKLLSQPGIKNKKFAVRMMGAKGPAEAELPKPEAEVIPPKEEKAAEEEKIEEEFEEEMPEEEDLLEEEEGEEEEFTEEEELPEEEFPEEEEL
jgi:flagellar motor switch protein FliM